MKRPVKNPGLGPDPMQLRNVTQRHRMIALAIAVVGAVLGAFVLWAEWRDLVAQQGYLPPDPMPRRPLVHPVRTPW